MKHIAPQLELPLPVEPRHRSIEVPGPELADTLDEEQSKGWRFVAMDMAGLSRWRITLEREVAGSLGPIGPIPSTESPSPPARRCPTMSFRLTSGAASVVQNVNQGLQGDGPDSERQARPLSALPPEKQAAAAVVENVTDRLQDARPGPARHNRKPPK